jgi:protein-S-isoprenylcysteine O-methyltransferase Ste14
MAEGVHWLAPVVMLPAYALFLWAMVSNAFFAEGVRIQEERGHTVCSSGPYRYVRHPGYVSSILGQLASPFLLRSWWALIPTLDRMLCLCCAPIWRTGL